MKHRKNIILGILLLAVAIGGIFGTAIKKRDFVLSSKEMMEDYDDMWTMLEENYPLFEAAEARYGIDRKEIYSKYRKKLMDFPPKDLIEFYDLLSECLKEFRFVGHLSLSDVDNFKMYQDMIEHNVNKNTGEVRVYGDRKVERAYDYLEKKSEKKGNFTEENRKEDSGRQNIRLEYRGSIPVITIKSFASKDLDEAEKAASELNAILKQCSQEKEIVIDLSGNSGGNTAIWDYGVLPFLGKDEIMLTSYYATMNGSLNQKMFPVDFLKEESFCSEGENRTRTFEIESHPFHMDMDVEKMTGHSMKHLNKSELQRCDMFLKVTKRITFKKKEPWKVEGKLWVFMDEHTASSAMDFAWVLKKAGLATILGPEECGFVGGFLLPPAQASMMLPNSGLVVRYSPYYILNDDGSCTEFGMKPDIIVDNLEFWLWKKGKQPG